MSLGALGAGLAAWANHSMGGLGLDIPQGGKVYPARGKSPMASRPWIGIVDSA